MRIGIDARLWRETGVGRYIRALVNNLMLIGTKHEFTLFLGQHEFQSLNLPTNWHKQLAPVHWHTLREQIEMPSIYSKSPLDILHVPYFSIPILNSIPLVITVHDLTISQFATGRATTLPSILYWCKRLGYELTLRTSLFKAIKIITVSKTIKMQLVDLLSVYPEKIIVTYEAGELEESDKARHRRFPTPFILYVGNAHPHKNIERLIKAFSVIQQKKTKLTLVLIGKVDYFYSRLIKLVQAQYESSNILFLGEASSSDLKEWYSHAELFIFPSLSEGFGIPGLEAMSMGCPVVAADLPVFHEIYGDAAYYFNQFDHHSIASCTIKVLTDDQVRKRLIASGYKQIKKYTWKKMAEETLKVYESCLGIRSGQ